MLVATRCLISLDGLNASVEAVFAVVIAFTVLYVRIRAHLKRVERIIRNDVEVPPLEPDVQLPLPFPEGKETEN
jgi:hypothetical protein